MEIFVTNVLTFVTRIAILDFAVGSEIPLKIGSTGNVANVYLVTK